MNPIIAFTKLIRLPNLLIIALTQYAIRYGIIYPILASLIEVLDEKGKKEDVNFYLIQVCFHSTVITSAITLTAMAANPLIVSIASTFGINISWSTWFIAAIIPGLLNLILMPIFCIIF